MDGTKKHKACRGCGEKGHNIKTCVNVDLDVLYAKLAAESHSGKHEESFSSEEPAVEQDLDNDRDDFDEDDDGAMIAAAVPSLL